MNPVILNSFYALKAYCTKSGYKGYDPYDGLNSTLFQAIPLVATSRLARLIWIQAFKRIPCNLRPLLGVKKDFNPKALGLFLSSYCNLYKQSPKLEYIEKINFFSEKLLEKVSHGWSGACWGYNFDWQARAFFQPKYTPTVVATTFIVSALLDAYEITGDERLLNTSRSACDFVLKDLNRTYDQKGNFAFSYSPLDESVVYNASLLGSRLLARVYSFTHEKLLIDAAHQSVEYCCDQQREDGSWGYGTYDFHQWVDSFHTGYNLECISDYIKFSGDRTFELHIQKGFDYYINTFFTEQGIPKYYDNFIYPIDVHAPAQMVITLAKLNKIEQHRELLDKVLNWTITNMQSKEGYFYYQINKYFSSKIPYMRWTQAWMFYALSTYLLHTQKHEADKNL